MNRKSWLLPALLRIRSGRLWIAFAFLAGTCWAQQIGMLPTPGSETRHYAPGRLLVRFRPGATQTSKAEAHASMRAQVMRRYRGTPGLEVVRLPEGITVPEAVRRYRSRPDVLYAEPDIRVHAQVEPSDTRFAEQWSLRNTGELQGKPGADIHATQAWDITTGSGDVVVAVIDSGVDYTHPDLAPNMFRNLADCDGDGVDDDANGWIDDCHGINAITGSGNPMDDFLHGTHLAGIIGASGNNGAGIAGVNWQVQILACKFMDSNGGGWVSDAITCLDYVRNLKERGVNIVATNGSWGSSYLSEALKDAIASHMQAGILFISAAGNDSLDISGGGVYPAGFGLPNMVVVASTDRTDSLAQSSNYGLGAVHLGAPGVSILSTEPNGAYYAESGTSCAAPHVTGVAALLKAQDPDRDWRAIKNLILAGGDNLDTLNNTVTGKRLNAYGALTCSNSVVEKRLKPTGASPSVTVRFPSPIEIEVLHINCDTPNGEIDLTVTPGSGRTSLKDDGVAPDLLAGDGIYSGTWTATAAGIYTLAADDGFSFVLEVVEFLNPEPQVWSLSPSPVRVGTTGVELSVFGTGFNEQSVVHWNGTPLPTTYFPGWMGWPPSGPTVSAAVPDSDLAAPGDFEVKVVNPAPGGGSSTPLFFEVLNPPANDRIEDAIEITSVPFRDERDIRVATGESTDPIPSCAGYGSSPNSVWYRLSARNAQRLVAGGSGLISVWKGSPAQLTEVACGTPFVSYGELAFNVVADSMYWIMASPAQFCYLSCFGPMASQPTVVLTLMAANPVPQVTSISPTAVSAGSTSTLTVEGSGFVSGSIVAWNGSDVPSTYINESKLTADVPANLIQVGSSSVVVRNPAPGGGTSLAISVTVSSFAVQASPAGLTIAADALGTFAIRVSAQAGAFRNTVNLSCGQLPAALTCSFAPTSGTPGDTIFESTLTVQVARRAGAPRAPLWLAMLVGAPLVGVIVSCNAVRRRALWMVMVLALVACWVGCGGGSPPPPPPTYTVQVVATSGTLVQSTSVNVQVR